MKRFLILSLAVGFGAVVGCAVPYRGGPSDEELAKADYGPPPPENHEELIRAYLKESLFDPFSAHYEFSPPEKAWWGQTGGLLTSRDINYGWQVPVRVNAKNRMGGYVGWQTYGFYFRDGQVAHVQDPPRQR